MTYQNARSYNSAAVALAGLWMLQNCQLCLHCARQPYLSIDIEIKEGRVSNSKFCGPIYRGITYVLLKLRTIQTIFHVPHIRVCMYESSYLTHKHPMTSPGTLTTLFASTATAPNHRYSACCWTQPPVTVGPEMSANNRLRHTSSYSYSTYRLCSVGQKNKTSSILSIALLVFPKGGIKHLI